MIQTDRYTLHIGECAQVMREYIADESIDLTVTSPPYDSLRLYRGYTFDFEAIADELWRVTKPGGAVVWVVGDQTINGSETGTSFRQALHFRDVCGFNLHDTMIYRRRTRPLTHNRYEQEFEYMFVLAKPGARTVCNHLFSQAKRGGWKYKRNGADRHRRQDGVTDRRDGTWERKHEKIRGNVWAYPVGGGMADKEAHAHPAIFPEALARDHILSWSNPGDVVLDPMCGSGTTGKMALQTGRRFIGIDISAEYINDIAHPRLEAAQPSLFAEATD